MRRKTKVPVERRKRIKSAPKFYTHWTVEESKQFINLYLDGARKADSNEVCASIAATLGRSLSAIKFRQHEVKSILTDGESGLPVDRWTPHMIQALDEVLHERDMKIKRAALLF